MSTEIIRMLEVEGHRAAANRIRVLEKGIRDGLRYLHDLEDEKALNALTGALADGYEKA